MLLPAARLPLSSGVGRTRSRPREPPWPFHPCTPQGVAHPDDDAFVRDSKAWASGGNRTIDTVYA